MTIKKFHVSSTYASAPGATVKMKLKSPKIFENASIHFEDNLVLYVENLLFEHKHMDTIDISLADAKRILKIDETILFNDKVVVFGNLPYNISTEIISKWIIKARVFNYSFIFIETN